MSRIHDMGARFGDGPARPDPQGIPQLGDWQARALALTLAAGGLGQWNIDMSRRAREQLAPRDYMAFSYFEKWLAGLADLLVEIAEQEVGLGEMRLRRAARLLGDEQFAVAIQYKIAAAVSQPGDVHLPRPQFAQTTNHQPDQYGDG